MTVPKTFFYSDRKINPIFQNFKVKKNIPIFQNAQNGLKCGIFNPIFIYSGYELKRRILINPIFELLKDENLSPFSSHIGFKLTVRFYIAECSIIPLLVFLIWYGE